MIYGLAIAFLVTFVAAHIFDPHGDAIYRPLSAFRDIPAGWVGYVMFALLIAIAALVTRVAKRTGDRRQFIVYLVVTIGLTLIAITPSDASLHDLAVVATLATLMGNYAWLLDRADMPNLLTAHLSIPLALVALDAVSYGCLWQKVLDLYFMAAVLIHARAMQRPARIGVGMSQKPPMSLRAGNTVHLEGEGLGDQRQQLVAV